MNRIDNLFASISLKNNQAVVLHSAPNIYYMSAYTGEGIVVIAHNIKAIITDFRYTEQAEKQSPEFEIIMVDAQHNHNKCLADLLYKNDISSVYAEQDFISHKSYEILQNAIKNVSILDLGNSIRLLRSIKDEKEISYIRKACEITGESLLALLPFIKEGCTEKEITARLEYIMKQKGSDELAFNTICAAGANGSLPHAVPGEYKVQKGDIITFDFGAKYKGYCADMTRNVSIGTPSDTMAKVFDTVKEAQQLGKDALKPGVKCSDIDKKVRDFIADKGYAGRFGHGLGHAVGIEIHEEPRLSTSCDDITKVNHILTVEPGIYLPGIGGVRIEDSCLVTENGNEALTTISRDLFIV